MLGFRVCLIILLTNFQDISGDCNDVDRTFSFTKVELCKLSFPCFFRCAMKCTSTIVDGCIENNNVSKIIIPTNVKILRRGAFRNLPALTDINMINTGLEEMEPHAFHNIPEGYMIHLSYNKLRLIRSGVFSKTFFNGVDLTSNQISTIEDYAFANMPELTIILLGSNLIEEINENWFSNSPIQYIILAKNKLKVIKIETLTKLTSLLALDVSYNQIYSVDVLPNLTKKLSMINLTGNNLTDLQFISGFNLEYLFVGLNNISHVDDESLNNFHKANVENIFVHPNPWQCICLKKSESVMRVRNITIKLPINDASIKWDPDSPICVVGEVKRNMCNGITEEQFKSGREDYFKMVSYNKFIMDRSEYGLFYLN